MRAYRFMSLLEAFVPQAVALQGCFLPAAIVLGGPCWWGDGWEWPDAALLASTLVSGSYAGFVA